MSAASHYADPVIIDLHTHSNRSDGTDSPTPQRIVTLWTGLEARQSMMLRIDRAGEPMIMAVGKP